ncbi:pentatricopeptide repeat-containing protein 1, mitochondrial [Mixophyes fleayi]|uniref:pentatricopeptide repeat-containing protein 1, mitochondrial n=1 Tax=Mixophyes fleayi TaxID=3061075 RepID=UPI003F4DEA39
MGLLQILTSLSSRSLISACLIHTQPVCRQICVVCIRTSPKHLSCQWVTQVRTYSDHRNAGCDLQSSVEENFGTLSDLYSSRKVFRKTSPELQNMQYVDSEKGEKKIYTKSRGRRNTPYWYFLQSKAKIKEGKLAEALELFEVKMLQEERLQPEESNYTVLIGGCGRAGYLKKAFQLYSNMKKRGLVPTDATYTALFNACAESPWKDSGLEQAFKLRKELMEKNIQLNLITYRSLLKVCTLSLGLQGSLEIFKEIAQRFRITSPDTFNVLFMGCIKDKELGFRYALQVWRQMLHMGIKPDINAYNLLIRATRDCGIGDADEAFHLLLHSKDLTTLKLSAGKEEQDRKTKAVRTTKECPGETVTRQLLLDNSLTMKDHDNTVMNLPPEYGFVEMNKTSQSPNKPSFNDCKLPNLLDLTLKTDTVVSLVNVNTPSARFALIGDLEGILQKMKEDKVYPTIKTFTLLAEVMKPDIQAEAILLDIMKGFQIQPDLTFFNTFLLKRSKTMNLKIAMELLPIMAQRGVAPNIYTFCNLARACRKKEDGLQLLQDMTIAGFHPNNNVYSTLIDVAIKRLDYIYLIDILRDMRNRNVAPNEVVIRQLEFAAQYPPHFDRHQKKNVFLERIDGFRGYYTRWLEWMDAEETEHPWKKYRTKQNNDSEASAEL